MNEGIVSRILINHSDQLINILISQSESLKRAQHKSMLKIYLQVRAHISSLNVSTTVDIIWSIDETKQEDDRLEGNFCLGCFDQSFWQRAVTHYLKMDLANLRRHQKDELYKNQDGGVTVTKKNKVSNFIFDHSTFDGESILGY